jgi:hypothetical protein
MTGIVHMGVLTSFFFLFACELLVQSGKTVLR